MNITHMNEHEQWEAIKEWWKSNGRTLIITVILVIAVSFGFRYWQQHQSQKAEQASVLYDQLLLVSSSVNSENLTKQIAAQLERDYTRTPYAGLAALIEAKMAIGKNDLPLARQKLQWSLEHASNKDLRQIARIRLARVFLALKQFDFALTTLEKIDMPAFMPLINQVKGDILLAQNKPSEALAAYTAALTQLSPAEPMRPYLQMQVDQLI